MKGIGTEVLGGNTRNSPPSTKPPSGRFRNYCFTSYTGRVAFTEKMKYLLQGDEICPTTGRPHIQGFVIYKNPRAYGSIIKEFTPIHVDVCAGDAASNYKYCTKDKKFTEEGEAPQQGERTDLNKIKEEIFNGKKVDDIALEKPMLYHQYGRTLNKIEDLAMRKRFRTEMTKGIWIWGKTGIGKSHEAFKDFSPETHYIWVDDKDWWDGYCQQETVVINDFRGQIKYSKLLELIDKWPVSVSRRNREPMPFLSKKIIITSSMHPETIYKKLIEKEDNIDQLLRRLEIINMKEEQKDIFEGMDSRV